MIIKDNKIYLDFWKATLSSSVAAPVTGETTTRIEAHQNPNHGGVYQFFANHGSTWLQWAELNMPQPGWAWVWAFREGWKCTAVTEPQASLWNTSQHNNHFISIILFLSPNLPDPKNENKEPYLECRNTDLVFEGTEGGTSCSQSTERQLTRETCPTSLCASDEQLWTC